MAILEVCIESVWRDACMTSASRILNISKRFISLARLLTSSTMTCSPMMAAAKAGGQVIPASANVV